MPLISKLQIISFKQCLSVFITTLPSLFPAILLKDVIWLASKHMKKCQPGWSLGNVYTIGITETNKTDNTKCWKRCEVIGYLIHYCWKYKMIKPLWKSIWQFLIKMNINLPYDATFPFLGIYLSRWKHVHRKTCTKYFFHIYW